MTRSLFVGDLSDSRMWSLTRSNDVSNRDTPMRRTPIRPVSKKRQREQRAYAKLRAEFLAEHIRCEFPGGCVQPATEVHHMRGRVGALYLDTTQWAGLCHAHHAWTTEHPAEAKALGISANRVGA